MLSKVALRAKQGLMRGYLHHYHIRHEQFLQPGPRYHKFNISP